MRQGIAYSQADVVQQLDRRRALGRLGEQIAARHLEGLRYSVLARNVRTRRREIDLIAFDGATRSRECSNSRDAQARCRGAETLASPL
jgi:putative endonuclease